MTVLSGLIRVFLTMNPRAIGITIPSIIITFSLALLAGVASAQYVAGDQARGRQVYDKYCGLCHGANGEGYVADDANALSNQDFLASVSDEFIWWGIARGRPGTAMAAHAERYGGPLEDADIDDLLALIRGWQTEPSRPPSDKPVIGDPVAGRITYALHCTECHGREGEGVSAVSLNNAEFLSLATDAQIRTAIAGGRRGTPMAAFGETLKADSIDNLVALIRSWERDVIEREAPDFTEFPEVVINPDGPAPRFTLRDGRYVSAAQLDTAMREGARLIILDSRPPSEWLIAHIPGAVPAPFYDPESIIIQLPEDDTWIVSYCACPHLYSDKLTDALRNAGFKNTVVLDEGVRWWQHQGYPVKYGR